MSGYHIKRLYVYLLLEFQSTIDPWMAVRIQTEVHSRSPQPTALSARAHCDGLVLHRRHLNAHGIRNPPAADSNR